MISNPFGLQERIRFLQGLESEFRDARESTFDELLKGQIESVSPDSILRDAEILGPFVEAVAGLARDVSDKIKDFESRAAAYFTKKLVLGEVERFENPFSPSNREMATNWFDSNVANLGQFLASKLAPRAPKEKRKALYSIGLNALHSISIELDQWYEEQRVKFEYENSACRQTDSDTIRTHGSPHKEKSMMEPAPPSSDLERIAGDRAAVKQKAADREWRKTVEQDALASVWDDIYVPTPQVGQPVDYRRWQDNVMKFVRALQNVGASDAFLALQPENDDERKAFSLIQAGLAGGDDAVWHRLTELDSECDERGWKRVFNGSSPIWQTLDPKTFARSLQELRSRDSSAALNSLMKNETNQQHTESCEDRHVPAPSMVDTERYDQAIEYDFVDANLHDDLEVLIAELSNMLGDRQTSVMDEYVEPGPIRGTTLYAAVKAVERNFGGKLPIGPWEAWRGILRYSDEANRDGDPHLRHEGFYQYCQALCDWARPLLRSEPEIGTAITDSRDHRKTNPALLPKNKDGNPTKVPTCRERRSKWLAEAMLLVRDHPDWSDAEIARRVGKDKSTVSRSAEYKAAAQLARAKKVPPKGHIVKNVNSRQHSVEAESPSLARLDRGKPILNSSLFREYCGQCGEPIRVCQDDIGAHPLCEDCQSG